jgi:hypothetical protein
MALLPSYACWHVVGGCMHPTGIHRHRHISTRVQEQDGIRWVTWPIGPTLNLALGRLTIQVNRIVIRLIKTSGRVVVQAASLDSAD